jgi:hypothetical protein
MQAIIFLGSSDYQETTYTYADQVVQANTLAREWLVSLALYRVGGISPVDRDDQRAPVEAALG